MFHYVMDRLWCSVDERITGKLMIQLNCREAALCIDDFGADAFVGEDFEKEAVWLFAVNKVDAVDAVVEGIDGAVCFRDHALADGAVFDNEGDFVSV